MTQEERKDYSQYLWQRLGIIVQYKGLYKKIELEIMELKRSYYGLDPREKYHLDDDKPLDGLEQKL